MRRKTSSPRVESFPPQIAAGCRLLLLGEPGNPVPRADEHRTGSIDHRRPRPAVRIGQQGVGQRRAERRRSTGSIVAERSRAAARSTASGTDRRPGHAATRGRRRTPADGAVRVVAGIAASRRARIGVAGHEAAAVDGDLWCWAGPLPRGARRRACSVVPGATCSPRGCPGASEPETDQPVPIGILVVHRRIATVCRICGSGRPPPRAGRSNVCGSGSSRPPLARDRAARSRSVTVRPRRRSVRPAAPQSRCPSTERCSIDAAGCRNHHSFRPARICSRRMSACPAWCASSRSTCSSSAHTGRCPRPSTASPGCRPARVAREAAHRCR